MDNNTELTKLLLSQLKERDEMIKSLVGNMTKLSDAYIIKDKEKDKRHTRTLRITIIAYLVAMTTIVSVFIWSYFWSSYPISTINGDGNSTISGNDNTNTQTINGGEN